MSALLLAALIGDVVCLALGVLVTWAVMCAREQRAERCQETRLANLSRLDEPEAGGLPSWVAVGWHGDGQDLSLASSRVTKASFQQSSHIERTPMQGFRRPLNLVVRQCTLTVEFPVYTLLRGVGDFDSTVGELRSVWRATGRRM